MKRWKKSLVLAAEEAQMMSIKHPGIIYRVMDKKYKRAVVVGSDWVYRERILEGWYTDSRYLNGKLI